MEKLIKSVFIMVAALAVGQTVSASDFVEYGKTWECAYGTPAIWFIPDYQPKKVVYYFDGDTLVNGRTCQNMYCSWEGRGTMFVAPFYEEEDKVFFYPYENATESVLLYDFAAREGDSIRLFIPAFSFPKEPAEVEQYAYCVTCVSDTVIDGSMERVLTVINSTCSNRLDKPEILQGIGTVAGPFGLHWWEVTGAGMVLEKCYTKDRIVFATTAYHPAQQCTPETSDSPFYDLQGRPVAHPTSGIYIQNGRKVMVREK